ncbi:hypothetical protein QBE52_11520 [Clostridiaceae bacterium 35-E11]
MLKDEFIGLMKISDAFDLVKLDKGFTAVIKVELGNHPLFKEDIAKLKRRGYLLIKKGLRNFQGPFFINKSLLKF